MTFPRRRAGATRPAVKLKASSVEGDSHAPGPKFSLFADPDLAVEEVAVAVLVRSGLQGAIGRRIGLHRHGAEDRTADQASCHTAPVATMSVVLAAELRSRLRAGLVRRILEILGPETRPRLLGMGGVLEVFGARGGLLSVT